MNRAPISPASALVAHMESVVNGGHVLVVGNAESCLAEQILERGARLVLVLDPEPRRVAEAAAQNTERRVTFAHLTESALRDSSFDCIVIEDLSHFSRPAELLEGVRRALSETGLALISCANEETSSGFLGARRGKLDYEGFTTAIDDAFSSVALLAQTPFLGYAVVDLDARGPIVPSLDNAYLLGASDDADYFVALASNGRDATKLRLASMTIVQLPAKHALVSGVTRAREERREAARPSPFEARIAELEAELKAAASETKRLGELEKELTKKENWIASLEARAESADERADDAEARLVELENELASLKADLGSKTELERALARLKQVEAEKSRLKDELRGLSETRSAEASALSTNEREAKLREEKLVEQLTSLERNLSEALTEKSRYARLVEERTALAERFEKQIKSQEKELDDLSNRLHSVHDRLDEALDELDAKTGPSVSDLEHDLEQAERQLVERAAHVTSLEKSLRELEVFAKSLTAELAQAKASAKDGGAERVALELEEVGRRLAEKEADLVAATWTIRSLEKRLDASTPAHS